MPGFTRKDFVMDRNKHTLAIFLFSLSLAFTVASNAQSSVTYAQLVFILKTLKPDLNTIGVLSTSLSEKDIASFTRGAQGQGVNVFIGQPGDAREISALYKKLVSEKKVQIIIIPSVDDKMILKTGFEFLAENAALDKVGLCVPDQELLTQGAFCYITKENGKFVAYVNQRVSTFVGAKIPETESPTITFVSR